MTEAQTASSDSRRRVLAAAAEEFARHGFSDARVVDIAARAGASRDVVDHVAGDKEELYAAVLLGLLGRALARIAPAIATARSPEGRLRAAVAGISSAAFEDPHFAPLLLREIASGGAFLPLPVVAHMQLLFNTFSHTLTHGAAGGVFRRVDPLMIQMALAGGLLAAIAGAPIGRRLRDDDASPELLDLADSVSELLLDGLRFHSKKGRRPPDAPSDSQRDSTPNDPAYPRSFV